MRIALMVKKGETIIDMFAGVGPFPLVIAKHASPEVIYAIDINEYAVAYMRKNIEMNKVGNIVPICGDSSVEIRELPSADRIIMNLPQMADSFLPDALFHLKKGGTVHLHKIMGRDTSEEEVAKLIGHMNELGFSIRVGSTAELKTYSPTMSVYVLDIIKE
jgi:tRNA (guanine37-N1)-methyltransferase